MRQNYDQKVNMQGYFLIISKVIQSHQEVSLLETWFRLKILQMVIDKSVSYNWCKHKKNPRKRNNSNLAIKLIAHDI